MSEEKYLSPHFTERELGCHGEDCCGHSAPVSAVLLAFLENYREDVSCPVLPSCGFRCHTHNRGIGSADTSQHPKGTAADIQLHPGGWTTEQMADVAEQVMALMGVTGGIGLYSWGIHVDVRTDGPARWDTR